jgi:hypothetical protein
VRSWLTDAPPAAQWLRDFTLQLRTDELSYQVQYRVNFELNIILTPIIPPRPPPRPPPPPPSPRQPPPPRRFHHGLFPLFPLLQRTNATTTPAAGACQCGCVRLFHCR